MKIGSLTPPWRVPTIIEGTLTFSSLSVFHGQPLILCCPTLLTANKALLLEAQVNSFRDRNVTLATFVSRDTTHNLPLALPSSDFRLPLLTDPLNRLSRALDLSRNLSPNRSETLFFNQHGRLNFRLIHDLNVQGLTRVLEITERYLSSNTHFQRTDPLLEKTREQSGTAEPEIQASVFTST